MHVADLTRAVWKKSRRSGNSGNCVEVAANLVETDGVVLVRDSKNRGGSVLAFTPVAWTEFIGGVQEGNFDIS